ncbi:MAG: hypothetical protein EB027_03570, partial [Actinobacteria bacterium]|nr:hypothetical protein [Actinomycetota bacterium]
MSRSRRNPHWIGVSAVAVALIGSLLVQPAAADSLERQIDKIESKVSTLERQAEVAAEAYNGAVINLRRIDSKKATLERRIASATRSMGQLLLSNRPQEFLDRSTTLSIVAGNQAAQLRTVNSLRLGLATSRAELTAIRKQRSAVYRMMKVKRDQVTAKLAQAQKVLRGLQGKARKIYQARLAKRRAEQAAAAKKARKQWSNAKLVASKAPSAAARRAVTYALKQIGKPYIAFMAGERAFDCSGLTQAAYKHAGVSLPHFSRAQQHRGKRISWAKMKPGDLMFFFGRGAHHVAMYIGGGKMVHAENPRSDVTITSIYAPWYRSRFSGAV